MTKIKENSLDGEYNNLRGQLGKIKDMTEGLHRDLSNISTKIRSLSKRREVSEEYKNAVEKETTRLLEKIKGILRIIEK